MKRDMQAWCSAQIAAPTKLAMPVLSFPAVQLMGITVKDLIQSADRQAEGMRLIAERVPSAASVSLMDLSLEAECFGSVIRVSDDEVPAVIGKILETEAQIDALVVPAVGSGRTGIYLSAMEKALQMIHDRPVFAGVIGPFSLAGRLMDVTEIMYACYDEPGMVHSVMEKTTQFLIDYVRAYRDLGANGVIMAEPLTGLLTPDLAEEFSCPYVKRIVEATRRDDFLFIYHNCGGATVQMIDPILSVGADGYHFGNAIDMTEMLPHIPKDKLCLGNIDPAGQFRNGTQTSITAVTTALMEACKDYPNFIISSGCDIPPASKWENIDAFFEAVAAFYKQ